MQRALSPQEQKPPDRRDVVRLFRERLQTVVDRSELSQTAFAERVGIDRSTLSQLLSPANDRLPRVGSVVAIAQTCRVSLDWLFGLSQTAEPGADMLAETMRIERDAPSPLDERLVRWHNEAAGYRVRYVPTTLPDALKTDAVIEAEYDRSLALSPRRRMEITQSRLEYLRRPETEIEICTPIQALEAFARGEGVWRDLPAAIRCAQLDHFAAICAELYPRLRWFLYDAAELYSVPMTIFGPTRAAIYLGQMYFVFHSTDHIRVLAAHFDQLVRAAKVEPTGMAKVFGTLSRLASRAG